MAKKKATRKATSRGTRKKAAVRRGVRKAASRPRAAAVAGLEHPRKVDLRAVKGIITAHIKRLEDAAPSPEVGSALSTLRATQATLSSACANAPIPMVIEVK